MIRLAVIVLAISAALGAMGVWQRRDGAMAERLRWEAATARQAQANAVRIRELEEQARQLEAERVRQLAAADARYQKGRADAQRATDDIIASLRAGSIGLRDPGAVSGGRCTDADQKDAAPGGNHAAEGGRLSATTAEFLVRLAGEADDVVRQLSACQAVLERD